MTSRTPLRAWTIFVGPEKTGTTWIDATLRRDDRVRLPDGVKETRFFDRHYASGMDWYLAHFRGESERRLVEVAPSYFRSEAAVSRIAESLEDPVVCVTVRHPVLRSISMYEHLISRGWDTGSFSEVRARHPDLFIGDQLREGLARLGQTFSPERVYVIDFDLLRTEPSAFIDAVYAALRLGPRHDLGDASSRENERVRARSHRLTSVSRVVADQLRAARLYWIVNAAKAIGFKRVLWKSAGTVKATTLLSDSEREVLDAELLDETVLYGRIQALRHGWLSELH